MVAVKNLVLLGGGHSHVHVLRSFGMNPVTGVQITLVTRDVLTPYSGMLPGYVAGHYTHAQCHIDLAKLAKFAKARLIHDTCLSIDPQSRSLGFKGRPELTYDCLSVDIGITPDKTVVPGFENITPVKPIDGFVSRIDALLARAKVSNESLRVVVVGGGAGGVEVAFALHHRMNSDASAAPESARHTITVVTRGKILSSHPPRARSIILGIAKERSISIVEQAAVTSVSGNVLHTESQDIPFDECLWCTQATPAAWLAACDLPKGDGGFLAINDYLQSAGGPEDVFAAGDVATSVNHPRPKAGVFAVRQGDPLSDNLRRFLTGQPLVPFIPQKSFLGLISTGNKHAIATRGSLAFSGDWLWTIKDRIDMAFMNKFGNELPVMPVPPDPQPGVLKNAPELLQATWSEANMRCRGCAAKAPADVLTKVLASLPQSSGNDQDTVTMDDAAVLPAVPAGCVALQTVDFLPSFVDDPFLFGGVTAVHALSDCFAMGAQPAAALAVVQVEHASTAIMEDTMRQMMHGAVAQLKLAGCDLIGGHSSEGLETGLGFCINGHAKQDAVMRKSSLQPGQALVLTKPLGSGLIARASMLAGTSGDVQQACWSTMLQSNQSASAVLVEYGIQACTDVTGFGLLGHASEMAVASNVQVHLKVADVPVLDGVQDVLEQGIKSTATTGNSHFLLNVDTGSITQEQQTLLLDPQTSGGLLFGVSKEKCDAVVQALRLAGCEHAVPVGQVLDCTSEASFKVIVR